MGEREYHRTFFGVEHTPPSISAIILEALAHEAEEDTGRKVTDVVITVPAYFGLLEKDATRKAGEIAGLNVIGIVPEPVAAALQYGISGSADGTAFLVYDLGGGTFDISLIQMTDTSIEVLVVGGDHRLGGADWDEKLLEHLVDQTIAQSGDDSLRDDEPMLQDLRIMAEDMKKALSSVETKTQIVRYTGSPAKITVTRAQFEEMTADLLDETIRITKRTLAEAEEKHPGITAADQRGSAGRRLQPDAGRQRCPAQGVRLGSQACRSGPGRGQGSGSLRRRADGAVRRGGSGGWAAGGRRQPGRPGPERSTARARSRD